MNLIGPSKELAMSNLGELFWQARTALGLHHREIAQLAGYKNIDKGVRRYRQIEDGDDLLPHREVLERFRTALKIDVSDVVMAQAQDFEELEKPIQPYIVHRIFPGLHSRLDLPVDCTIDQSLMTAKALAEKMKTRMCLVLSKIRCIYCDPDGSTEHALGIPIMSIGSYNKSALRFAKRVAQIPREGQHFRTERQP